MTFWLDAQLDRKIARWMTETFGVAVKTLYSLGQRDADDRDLFLEARMVGCVAIITKDYDFVELLDRLGSPPPIVYLACGNLLTAEMKMKLLLRFAEVNDRIAAGEPLVVID